MELEQSQTWLFQQAPAIVILVGIVLATFWKGWAVPGHVYKREVERADRMERLLLRSMDVTEKAASVVEKVVDR